MQKNAAILEASQASFTPFFQTTSEQIYQQHRRLKIAIVTETWPPEINGVALSVLQLTKGLQNKGHKILLVRPKQKVKTYDFIPDQECLVKPQSIPKYSQLQCGWPQLFKISQAFDEFRPDIVHIVTEGPLGLAALKQAKLKKIPISSGFHSSFHDFSRYFDLAFLVKPVRKYLKWFHNQTDLTCVPSQDTREVLKIFGLKCPMRVVGRGVDSQRFNVRYRNNVLRTQWQADHDTTVLLHVGRVSPEKEILFIIHSYLKLTHAQPARKFRLVIVGDGPQLPELQKNYPDVVFMNVQSGEALSACYASADAFVFASQVETFGNVVLEAMSSGLPVLAYDYTCAGMMLDDQQSGWLVPLGHRQAWTEQLLKLPPTHILKNMGAKALTQVEHVGWDRPIAEFEMALLQYAKKSKSYI